MAARRKNTLIDAHIGRQLRQLRQLRGLSQTALGELPRFPVSFQQIQKYETGSNALSAARLWELARALNVSPLYFFDGLEETAPHKPRPNP